MQGVPAPPPPTPSSPCRTGQQAQQQQGHVDPQAQASTMQHPGQQVVHLNWSYFKPECSGKPDEDAEAHLPHTNDWIECTSLH